jgi:Tfp pilus tip-associated adhesin PilY1
MNSVVINDTDPCVPSLAGWQMVIDAFTGDNPPVAVFDDIAPAAGTPFTAGVSGPGSLGASSAIATLNGNITIFTGGGAVGSPQQPPGKIDCKKYPDWKGCQGTNRTSWRRGQ